MAKPKKAAADKAVTHFTHDADKRKNIPTAELQSLHKDPSAGPKELRYPRNPDLDPQLVWRGKDQQDWSDLVVPTPPLYIQEKVHPKALIDDLLRRSKERAAQSDGLFGDLFQDFDGLPKDADKTEFYQHDANWANRMILGDSLQVMASLAEREAFRLTHEAGLGASVEELEKPVLIDTFALIRRKVRDWGITLRPFHHPKLGTV